MTLASMTLLIANRGEIACRIARTARRLGIRTIAVYSDADRHALHVRQCDDAVAIGPSPATDSYLVIDKIIAAAIAKGATAIHPGYGFLSENADLPDACAKAGLIFVGPSGAAMRALGGKAAAKEIAIKAGVPVVPGYQGANQDPKHLAREARKIGYPVMIKAIAGGGGRGMRLVTGDEDFSEALDSAKREAASAFGNDTMLIEKFVQAPRHIEVQIFGDTHGNAVHLFERDCSLQRRNQKVIEEAPAPDMSPALRKSITEASVKLAKSVGYAGAGTVEFLVEGGALTANAPWYFIEMNTRLQVEHPVTEEITGLDLVEWQLRIAAGEKLPKSQDQITMQGHAIELRLCAEDPANSFMPSIGTIVSINDVLFTSDPDVRIESGVQSGSTISPFYDSMIAKVIGRGDTRDDAIRTTTRALGALHVVGLKTNTPFLMNLLIHRAFKRGTMDTGLIARHPELTGSPDLDPQMVLAGAAELRRHSRHASTPWSTSDAFQLGGTRQTITPLLVDGAAVEITESWPGGNRDLSFNNIKRDPHLTPVGANLSTHLDGPSVHVLRSGVHITVAPLTYDASSIDDVEGSGAVRAPINGRVAKVFVAEGDSVTKGARIAIVEAMKMEHSLVAGADGRIEKITVTEGQQVSQGTLIATIA